MMCGILHLKTGNFDEIRFRTQTLKSDRHTIDNSLKLVIRNMTAV